METENNKFNSLIICVDDEAGVLESYKRVLTPENDLIAEIMALSQARANQTQADVITASPTYELLLAQSGEEAIQIVEQELAKGRHIAAGFFDMRMPGMDGYQTIAAIRKRDSNIICAVVTAFMDREVSQIRQLFIPEHQDELLFFKKPFSPEELEQTALNMASSWNRKRKEEHYIVEQKRIHLQLQLAAKVFECTAEGVIITDAEVKIVAVNKAFTTITGFTENQVIGKNPRLLQSKRHDNTFYDAMWNLLKKTGQWQGEIWNSRLNGEIYPQLLSINSVYDTAGKIVNYVGVFTDTSSIKSREAQMDHMLYHDALTDLPNRLLFNTRLTHAIQHAHQQQTKVAILLFDLDRFKNVNKSLGHPVGDQLLQAVVSRLATRVRDKDTMARLGGDEFAIIVTETERAQIILLAQGLLDLFANRFFWVKEQGIYITCSIGISVFPDDGNDTDTLIKNADAAMFQAKKSGRNGYHFYTKTLTASASQSFTLESELRRAIKEDEFELYYQPKIAMPGGAVIGCEALIRWQHREQGMIQPNIFIPLAEDTGLIVAIGEWVFKTACLQTVAWRTAGFPGVPIAVNLSGAQIGRDNMIDTFTEILSKTGADSACLEIEITESFLMQQPDNAILVLHKLKTLGFTLTIDDFGTGYSSLSYLKRFPLDKLKIDQSFVRDAPHDVEDVAIIKAIIAMAHSLQLGVVAEGVETKEQMDFLKNEGCDQIQGYFYSPPIPIDELEKMLSKTR